MKKFITIAAVAALTLVSSAASAQSVRTDWNDIDKVVVYNPVHLSEYNVMYVLPVDDSAVEFEGKPNKKVIAAIKDFRKILKKKIDKKLPELEVRIVEEAPAELASNEVVLNLKYVKFDLGSKAARFFSGYAGGAKMGVVGSIAAEGKQLVDFETERYMGINPIESSTEPGMTKSFEERVGKDIAIIFRELSKE